MIITPLPSYPYTKVDKAMKTVHTTVIEPKLIDYSPYAFKQGLAEMVRKKADARLERKAKALGADAVLCAHYTPYATKFSTGTLSDDSYCLGAYGVPVKFKR